MTANWHKNDAYTNMIEITNDHLAIIWGKAGALIVMTSYSSFW